MIMRYILCSSCLFVLLRYFLIVDRLACLLEGPSPKFCFFVPCWYFLWWIWFVYAYAFNKRRCIFFFYFFYIFLIFFSLFFFFVLDPLKYERIRCLGFYINKIRQDYWEKMRESNKKCQQLGVVIYVYIFCLL
jgi:hypothetical protein